MKQFFSVKEAVKSTFTGKRRQNCSVMPVGGGDRPQPGKCITMTIPTFSSINEAEEVDISHYTQDDLERLRLEDPFLYYSIPAMKRSLFESNSSSTNSPARSINTSQSSRRSSCPTILLYSDISGNDGPQQQQQQQRRGSVTRARRLSTEPHPSFVMQNIMNEMNLDEDFDDDDDSDMDEEDEKLIQALANGTFDL